MFGNAVAAKIVTVASKIRKNKKQEAKIPLLKVLEGS